MRTASPNQKEYFSRAWIIAAAAAANFSYQISTDDTRGVDMTVMSDQQSLDFQLKATSRSDRQGEHWVYDLDVRTYDFLRSKTRAGYGVLALVLLDEDVDSWHVMDDQKTQLAKAAYYLPLFGMAPTSNKKKIRLKVPCKNLLTPAAMRDLMKAQESRWT